MKPVMLALGALLLASPAWSFDSWDLEERRKVITEMDQVRRHDYTYQVNPNGSVTPRNDRYSNYLRRTRDPRTLRFPYAPEPAPRRGR